MANCFATARFVAPLDTALTMSSSKSARSATFSMIGFICLAFLGLGPLANGLIQVPECGVRLIGKFHPLRVFLDLRML